MAANSKCPAVIAGADQKTTRNPAIRGCRIRPYTPRWLNGGGLYPMRRACSHADLFGLRQAWLHARRVRYSPPPFTERGVYGRIRHPLMAGFLVVFWAAPTMTAGHLLFAATATGYILAGIAFEEHDLMQDLGDAYAAYRARVPALIPRLRHPSRGAQRSGQDDGQQATRAAGQ